MHLAIGYPGLRFLPDLQAFRESSGDYEHVVNAYEPHEHVYEFLKTKPGTVVLRGGGIVASRVLQRLFDDREKFNTQTKIVHIFRTFVTGAHGPHIWTRRKGGDGWAYQGFNYPKSVWGGQLKAQMRKLEGEARAKKYKEMGGTNTPKRRRWQKQMAAGPRRAATTTAMQGTVDKVTPGPDGMLTSFVTGKSGAQEVHSHYIIDCTGLEADIAEHRVLADLLAHGGAGRNPLGRLEVERHFEVKGTAERRRRPLRFRGDDAGRLLPRRGHVPRAAGRGPGDRRRPGPAGLRARRSDRCGQRPSGSSGLFNRKV